MLKPRTDLPAIIFPEPLSKESVQVLFDRIRLDLGLPIPCERQERLQQLEKAGYFQPSTDVVPVSVCKI